MAKTYDAIIIGTGQSGPLLAARLTEAGMKCAILERKLFGGTCVNTGCIPTKTLVASARAIHLARRDAEFGFEVGGPVRVEKWGRLCSVPAWLALRMSTHSRLTENACFPPP